VSERCHNKKQKRAHRHDSSQSLHQTSTVVPTLICFQEFLLRFRMKRERRWV
jgi:hypothetical protein